MNYSAPNVRFARYLHIPQILIEAAILDRVLSQLIRVHVEGDRAYAPEACETFNEEVTHVA